MTDQELLDEVVAKILSGNRDTTAANLRSVLNDFIDAKQNIDGKDQNGGYLGIFITGRVDESFIHKLAPTGQFLKDDGTWDDPDLPALPSAEIFVGNVSNVATAVVLSLSPTDGAFGLSNSGVLTFPDASAIRRGLVTPVNFTKFDDAANATVQPIYQIVTGTGSGLESSPNLTFINQFIGPSYSNINGQGNRIATMGISTSLSIGGGPIENIIDGTLAQNFFFLTNSSGYILFDFISEVNITECKWYMDTSSQGTWQFSGSHDNISYTTVSTSFTLTGYVSGTTPQTITNLSTNIGYYRYYKMELISGSTNNSPYVYEIEFKISQGLPNVLLYVNGMFQSTSLAGIGIRKVYTDAVGNLTLLPPAAPSYSAGAGAGTSPTISIVGNNETGEISITTGTTPSANADIITLTYSGSFAAPNSSTMIPYPADDATALAIASVLLSTKGTATTVTLRAGSAGLPASTSLKFKYQNNFY